MKFLCVVAVVVACIAWSNADPSIESANRANAINTDNDKSILTDSDNLSSQKAECK